jgi:hypothetical protein
MATPKKTSEIDKKALDTFSQKRGRGRPTDLRFTEIVGRADHFRWILDEVWERLWPLLSRANCEEEVTKAFQEGASQCAEQFVPFLSALTLQVLREKTFPKRRKAQTHFLADSLAALGKASPRRSRDICAAERAKAKRAHHILRCEFYVECSCGYKGPSKDHACRKCGAKINQVFLQLSSRM